MGSRTKLTNTRRRMKVARKTELRTRKSVKKLSQLRKTGFNIKIVL